MGILGKGYFRSTGVREGVVSSEAGGGGGRDVRRCDLLQGGAACPLQKKGTFLAGLNWQRRRGEGGVPGTVLGGGIGGFQFRGERHASCEEKKSIRHSGKMSVGRRRGEKVEK